MTKSLMLLKAIVQLCLTSLVLTEGHPQPWLTFEAPKGLASKFSRDPQTISLASTDFGKIVYETPKAVFQPQSVSDISELIKFSNCLPNPFTIAPRGEAHSVLGQPLAENGVVVNMTNLNRFKNGPGIVVSDGTGPLGFYADVGGEQLWIDVLRATLKYGLTPLSWTNYLYLTVGGTLSNAGISGHAFRFGPQISNVLELDVVTGEGELVTCSTDNNSEAFFAVLGGLGQFGIITRARIPLRPAPTRAKWLRLLYNDFSAYSRDQEYLISFDERNETNASDFVGSMLLLNQSRLDLSFYPPSDQQRITSLVTQYSIIYVLELVKYFDQNTQTHVKEEVANLTKGLNFIPTMSFEKDVSYEEFLSRIKAEDSDIPQIFLDAFVPSSRISDFNEGVFKNIILKKKLAIGFAQIYPTNRNKWDDRVSAVIPDEDVFYLVSIFASAGLDEVDKYRAQNQEILQFCKGAGIKLKEYLAGNKTHQEWVEHFGSKWNLWEDRKAKFDPNIILSPGQGIFPLKKKY